MHSFPGSNNTFAGRITGGAQNGTIISGSVNPGVSPSNLFGPYYANPVAVGAFPTQAGQGGGFGAPVYSLPANTGVPATPVVPSGGFVEPASNYLSGLDATGDLMGSAAIMTSVSPPPTAPRYTPSILRAPAANLGTGTPTVAGPLKPRADLQEVVARSSSLPSKDTIQVLTDGATVVLRGTVASTEEARLAQALLRLSPGAERIRNELAIIPPAGASTRR
jgi:hypothetical protein